MSLGLFQRFVIIRTTKKVINKIMRNIDQTLQANPRLTLEESLRIIDKKKGIFFPDEQYTATDLKSLFTMIVWKSYQYERSSNPDAASPAHRESVVKIVNDYLNYENMAKNLFSPQPNPDKKPLPHKVLRPAPLAISVITAIIFLGIFLSFHSKIQESFSNSGKDKYGASVSQNNFFRYNGHLSNDRERMALVNKTIHYEGDLLGEHDGYILKSIHAKYIVIQNKKDQSEFSVFLQ
ncbi:MAG: hypothetical protein ACYDGO_00820 [Smithellaceae bacterium]